MVNDLVRNAAVVLQDIEVHGTGSLGNLLRDGLDRVVSSFVCRVSEDLAGVPPGSSSECSDKSPLRPLGPETFSTYQDLEQVLVGDIGQLCAVELGDDELFVLSAWVILEPPRPWIA